MRYENKEYEARALEFRRRLREAGISIAEFARRSGLTRNVVYRLSKGQHPKSEQHERIERVLSDKTSTSF